MDIMERATEKFSALIKEQLDRVERMKKASEWIDYNTLNPIIIGVCWGDGIGEVISKHSEIVLKHVLQEECNAGKIEFRDIKGLTIENRARQNKAIPDDVLDEIKACHVILKGPTTTPRGGRANRSRFLAWDGRHRLAQRAR